MDWLTRLNGAVDYIEENLDGEIDIGRAASIALCSSYHFQRMFPYIAGVTLAEYIRRRRMTVAALELSGSGVKVIDLALKYGYESPTAFNRAFKSIHGIAPNIARKDGAPLKAYPRMSFKLSIVGDGGMDYKIVKKDAFRIVGIKEHMSMRVEKSFARVPEFWAENNKSGKTAQIISMIENEPRGLLGISAGMDGENFDYYIAAATDKPLPDGMVEYTVPAATWAVFECVGAMPEAMQSLQKKIFSEWLPASGYEYDAAPDIEVYFEGDQYSPGYRCETWLPVKKSAKD